MGGALAEAGKSRQEVSRTMGVISQRKEEIMQRLESAMAEPQASGSKRKRVESDDEYKPHMGPLSEEESPAC